MVRTLGIRETNGRIVAVEVDTGTGAITVVKHTDLATIRQKVSGMASARWLRKQYLR